ncbi:MAG: 8-oxo-dGTP diphosphatase MutT [Pseudomonadota bacterium]
MGCIEALEQPRPDHPSGLPNILVAAVVLVNTDGEVLLAKRPEGKSMAGLWEFPGGKVKEGESPEFALARELAEELGIETRECCFAPLGFASHSYDDFHLLMPLYACRMWKGEPKPIEGQELAWVKPNDLAQYDMPEADIPLIYQIQDRL